MPYDPANFTFSYSHSHRNTTGHTTVYEKEDNWRGSMNYNWTPVYKPFEPFKKYQESFKVARLVSQIWLKLVATECFFWLRDG